MIKLSVDTHTRASGGNRNLKAIRDQITAPPAAVCGVGGITIVGSVVELSTIDLMQGASDGSPHGLSFILECTQLVRCASFYLHLGISTFELVGVAHGGEGLLRGEAFHQALGGVAEHLGDEYHAVVDDGTEDNREYAPRDNLAGGEGKEENRIKNED